MAVARLTVQLLALELDSEPSRHALGSRGSQTAVTDLCEYILSEVTRRTEDTIPNQNFNEAVRRWSFAEYDVLERAYREARLELAGEEREVTYRPHSSLWTSSGAKAACGGFLKMAAVPL